MTASVKTMDKEVWGPLLGAAATAIGAALLWMAQRLLGKAAVQTSLNQGFKELMEQMRTELREACHQRDEFKVLLAREREGREADRLRFNGEMSQLRAMCEGMERLLRNAGIEMPLRKTFTIQPIEMVSTTLRQDGVEGGDLDGNGLPLSSDG